MGSRKPATHRHFPCPTEGCESLLKVPVDAIPGVYWCQCKASAVRYRVENRKQAVGEGLTEERWIERAPRPSTALASAGEGEKA